MECIPLGLAGLLRAALGPRWPHLHPDIRARFTLAPGASRQRFSGVMRVVERAPLGWLIARLIAFVRVLPAARARDVPFEFRWLSVGRFTLRHRNIDAERFMVSIRLQHPLLGRLFYQCGTFQQVQPGAAADAAFSAGGAPGPAISATRGSAYC